MTNATEHQFSRVVELSEGIAVRTNIKETYLPALRAGFAGYPVNPRWTASKLIAWKVGQQWKHAFQEGNLSSLIDSP